MIQTDFKKTVLDNGLRVLTERHPDHLAVSVGVWAHVGTRDEEAALMGASHLLEHMVFKATKTRSAYEIAKSLEAVGGEINAFTTREYTCFHTYSLQKDLDLSLDVLSDLVIHPKLAEEDFIKEKEVILQEIYMSQDQLEDCIFDFFFEKAYGTHPLGWPILGTEETIQNFKREDLESFFKKWYTPENMVITVTGDINHESIVALVEKYFAHLPKGTSRRIRIPPNFSSGVFKTERPSEQVHILLGMPAASYLEESRFEAYILNCALGGGMTSQLYQNIREEKGLAYSVYSTLNSYQDSGMLMIYAATTPEQVAHVVNEAKKELKTLCEKGLTQEELDMYKTQVKNQLLLGADDIENRMSSIGVNELMYESYRSIDHVLQQIDKVTTESIRRYLNESLQHNNLLEYYLGGLSGKSESGSEMESD